MRAATSSLSLSIQFRMKGDGEVAGLPTWIDVTNTPPQTCTEDGPRVTLDTVTLIIKH